MSPLAPDPRLGSARRSFFERGAAPVGAVPEAIAHLLGDRFGRRCCVAGAGCGRVVHLTGDRDLFERNGDILFTDSEAGPCLVSALRSQIQQHTEKLNATIRARRSQEQLETERLVKERILAEERTNQQRL